VFESAAREASVLGEDGERALIAALEVAGSWRKFKLATWLGCASGDLSLRALRELLAEPRPNFKEARDAALHYLAVRLGPGATGDLVHALDTRSAETLYIAVQALCAVGDASGWIETARWLRRYVRRDRRRPLDPPEAGLTLAYLAFTADAASASTDLVLLTGQIWDRLKPVEKEWITRWWPAGPGGTAPVRVPDPERLSALKTWADREFRGPH
jgi:hypothetical protein